MLLLLVLAPGSLAAQTTAEEKARLTRELQGELMCTCSCRRPLNDCPMEPNCHGLDEQRAKLAKFVDAGMTRDEVLAAFVKDHGSQEILMRPIDRGFNRLAWLFPYIVGASGAVLAFAVARRWSRREGAAEPARAAAPQDDPELRSRLDDELRDLD
jgi:cytochrome c-type biogenesis protein CcmH/NrfF